MFEVYKSAFGDYSRIVSSHSFVVKMFGTANDPNIGHYEILNYNSSLPQKQEEIPNRGGS